ncbi:Hypothetical_protein [Hexamita inflata]|uniref:Hypothetical_protein n=1 Tax=Hexamita inflata TaxID=28002 RepID=A0AA86NCM6_9EUKA|nr:Hypothetical protein HINF_LOCUS4388 [Hexamita inflata]
MIAKHEKTYWTNIIGLKIQQMLKDLASISVTQRLQDGIAKRHIIVMINITHLYQYISGIYISVCIISKLVYVNYQIIPVIYASQSGLINLKNYWNAAIEVLELMSFNQREHNGKGFG